MSLIIDGYNLLNAVGITGRGPGPSSLERSRTALLNFLAGMIDPAELPHAIIVFDAREAPPGLPRTVRHRGLMVRFADKQGGCRYPHRGTDPGRQFAAAFDGSVQRPSRAAGSQAAQGQGGRRGCVVRRGGASSPPAARIGINRRGSAARPVVAGTSGILAASVRWARISEQRGSGATRRRTAHQETCRKACSLCQSWNALWPSTAIARNADGVGKAVRHRESLSARLR